MKKIHCFSGLTITAFVALHLFNHLGSVFGADKHIEMMQILRLIYRNIVFESILMLAIFVQIFSGIHLFLAHRKVANSFFEKLHGWSGLNLALFFMIHLSAVFAGRFVLKLDTNFYFGVAGLNTFPFNLFFVPYYSLAILSFFGHLASVHNRKMESTLFGLTPFRQSIFILGIGFTITFFIFYGLTNHFKGVVIPKEYNILIAK